MTTISNKTIFQNRNKEAKFWKQNFTPAWKKGKPVKIQFSKNLSETINVRFDSHTINTLRNQAQKRGLGATQLIRMWILEKLQTS